MSDELKVGVYLTACISAIEISVYIAQEKSAGLGLLIFGFCAVILSIILINDIKSGRKDERLRKSHEQLSRLYYETYGQYDIGEVRHHGEYRGEYPQDKAQP